MELTIPSVSYDPYHMGHMSHTVCDTVTDTYPYNTGRIYNTMKVFIPIIASLCVELNLNPLYLCIPVTFACSFAFM